MNPTPDGAAQVANEEQTRELEALRAEVALQREWIGRVRRVCEAARRGELEDRLLELPESGELSQMLVSVNDAFDVIDAFVREARVSLEYASREKFYRRIALRGLLGSYRHAAVVINEATEVMAAKTHALAELDRRRASTAQEFEGFVGSVVSSVGSSAETLEGTCSRVVATVEDALRKSSAVETAAREMTGEVSAVAAATEELTATSNEIARKVGESSQIARGAVDEAQHVRATVSELAELSKRVDSVLKLITSVASQTNLLALNAAIEAARAGEAGHGFAVVASEVKKLAQESARATESIAEQVRAIQTSTGEVVSAIDRIGNTIAQMNQNSTAITSAVEQQNLATRDISESLHRSAVRTREVGDHISSVADGARATAKELAELVHSSGRLRADSTRLEEQAERFLGSIRGTNE